MKLKGTWKNSQMCKLIFVALIAIGASMSPVATAQPAAAATCSQEKKACHSRCRNSYGYKGDVLKYCQMVSCGKAFERCMATGTWFISRTGESKSLQKK